MGTVIRMMHGAAAMNVQSRFQRVEYEARIGCPRNPPTDDPPSIGNVHEGDVEETGSETQSLFGAGASNTRLTWSSEHGATLSWTVVRFGLPANDTLQAEVGH